MLKQIATAALALMATAAPAWAWSEVECRTDNSNTNCLTSVALDDGNGYGLLMTGEGLYLLVVHKGWDMPARKDASSLISVDRSAPVQRNTWTNGDTLFIKLQTPDLPLIVSGTQIRVRLPQWEGSYPLQGSREAMRSVLKAYFDRVGAPDPLAGAEQPAQSKDPFVEG